MDRVSNINNRSKIDRCEMVLQHSWNCIPLKTKLYTINGDEVVVLFPGRWNFEEGPDFKSARVSINNNIIIGDVEVHRYPEDWMKHGHHNDKRYDNVILHIIEDTAGDGLLKQDKIPDIPTLILPDKLIHGMFSDKIQKYPYGYCASKLNKLSNEILSDFFENAGEKRFCGKTAKIIKDILKDGVETAFLKYYFDSCGYKKNRDGFLELFNRFIEYGPDTLTIKEAVVVLWCESGLLPDTGASGLTPEMKDFIEGNWLVWWKLRKGSKEKIVWHLSSVRPLNNPCRRIAAICVFISRFGVRPFTAILDEFNKVSEKNENWKTFKELLLCRDGLWDKYSNPYHKLNRNAAVIGKMRALDIMANVVLPFIYAYADIHSLVEIREKALSVWKNLPVCQPNIITKICSGRWLIPNDRAKKVFNTAAAQQGAIFVYRKFCEASQMNCIKCRIFRELSDNGY